MKLSLPQEMLLAELASGRTLIERSFRHELEYDTAVISSIVHAYDRPIHQRKATVMVLIENGLIEPYKIWDGTTTAYKITVKAKQILLQAQTGEIT